MKRFLILVTAATLLAVGGVGQGSPVSPVKALLPQVPQLASQTFAYEFKGEQLARVLAIGDGATYMGLYVYDIHGNCVAWDDNGSSATRDDLAVAWQPRQNGVFLIELCNCGVRVNQCKVVIR
jgi:hypothetical protein